MVSTLNLVTFALVLAYAARELWIVRTRRSDDAQA